MPRLLLPALALVLSLAARAGWFGELPEPEVLLPISRALLALALLLAWRFRHGRIVWVAVAMLLVMEGLQRFPAATTGPGSVVLPVAAFLLPVHFAAAAVLNEWRVASATGGWRLTLLGAEVLVIATLSRPELSPLIEPLRRPLPEPSWLPPIGLPSAAVASLTVAVVLLGIQLARRREPLEMGLLGALLASAFALGSGGGPFFFGAAGLILALAVMESAFSLAFEDGLTGLPGRRALEETLLDLGPSYAIAMVDIDHFKKINDRHGHEVGDQVLRLVAGMLARVGGGGTAYRYGGEEFAVLFPGASAAEAEPHLEALRQVIAEYRFALRGPDRPKNPPKTPPRGRRAPAQGLTVTVSLGVADPGRSQRTPQQVLKAADQALYRAKKAGRNRLVRMR